jgi:Flp pilus assembly protein TadG
MTKIRMSGPSARRRRTTKGNVLVESALIFLMFFSMLIGVFDFGQFLFIHQSLVERVRSAARWGAINNPTDSAAITNMVLYNQSATPPLGTSAYFSLTADNVFVTTPGSGSDNYRLNLQVSGYSYSIFSLNIAGSYVGPPITVSVPLGLFN